jgi:hypothetical protein
MTITNTRSTPTPTKPSLTTALLAAVAIALLVLVPSAAFGARAHAFGFVFGGVGSGSGGLSLVAAAPEVAGSGVGVDGVSGDVFVADGGNHRVDEFSPSGVFVRMFGGEVDKTTKGNVCTAASGDTCGPGVSGSSSGEFEDPAFVAVDEGSGGGQDIYVADVGDNAVSRFDAEGNLVASWGDGGLGESADGQLTGTKELGSFGEPAGIAVDEAGDLWVYVGGTAVASNNHMYEFDRAGALQRVLIDEGHQGGYSPRGIAVDAVGDLYEAEGSKVLQKFSQSGSWLGTLAITEDRFAALAVDRSQRGLYLAGESNGLVSFYSSECEPSTLRKGCPATETFGEGHIGAAAGIAVDPTTGTVYVTDSATNQVVVFPVTVEANSLPATSVTATSAVLNGDVNPEGSELASCRFEYGETTAYTGSLPCEESASIGSGDAPVEVHANVTGLTGGGYHFRLAAHNTNGVVHSEDQPFQALPLASIDQLSSTEITATSAKLVAQVNPNGLAGTAYHFEYDTHPYKVGESGHGTNAPAADQSTAPGTSDVEVSQVITGLTAGTTYYFRVVVSDVDGARVSFQGTFIDIAPTEAEPCPNEALRHESNVDPKIGVPYSAQLPDCRAYEIVSPPGKNGALLGEIGLKGLNPEIAETGGQVTTAAIQCFASASSCAGVRGEGGQPFGFTRGDAGWAAAALTLPVSLAAGDTTVASNPNSGNVLFGAVSNTTSLEEAYARTGDGTVRAIGPVSPISGSSVLKSGALVDTTADMSHVVWDAGANSGWVFGGLAKGSLFEYSGFGNASPTLVAVTGGAGSSDLIGSCGESLGGSGQEGSNLYGSLSADGSVVYFTVETCPAGGTGSNAGVAVPARELYARVNGSQTVLISRHATEGCGEPGCVGSAPRDANFQGASRDGSRVFFTSTQRLTDDATQDTRSQDTARTIGCSEVGVGASGCNLYESECAGSCSDPAARHLVDVSAGDSSGVGPRVQGVMAISPDGSHVYFVAQGALTETPNVQGQEPVAGGDNLYVYERDSEHPAGHLAFVSTLPGGTETSESNEWAEGVEQADVTDDGGVLVFESYGALTADALPGSGFQVYRYDAASGVLQRVSIGAGGGFDDNGNAGGAEAEIVPDWIFERVGPGRVDPTMSADGSRVFFMSARGLTPGALNEVPQHEVPQEGAAALVENVYEWEADGKGSCHEAQGCVYLISDGGDTASKTGLLGADATGENVLIATTARLVGQDTDTELDYYDARVDGGFPRPTATSSCGSAGECHSGGSEPPGSGSPGSQSFTGPGNPAPTLQSGRPSTGKPPNPAQVRAAKLKKALDACRKYKSHKKRASCQTKARKRYGPKRTSKPTSALIAWAHERMGG